MIVYSLQNKYLYLRRLIILGQCSTHSRILRYFVRNTDKTSYHVNTGQGYIKKSLMFGSLINGKRVGPEHSDDVWNNPNNLKCSYSAFIIFNIIRLPRVIYFRDRLQWYYWKCR